MGTGIRAFEVFLLALAVWPLTRLLASRKLFRLFPRLWAAALCLLVLWAAAAALLAVVAPVGLHPLAALAGIAVAVSAARGLPAFRSGRAVPPGSLSLAASLLALADRRFYLDQAERHGPIFKMAQFHRNAVCVVGLERGRRLLRDHGDSIGPCPLPFTREIPGGFLRYMDGSTHARYAPLFRRALAKHVVAAAAPLTAEATRRELGRMAADCPGSPGNAVRPGPYLRRIVHDAFMQTLFGLTQGTAAYEAFESAYPPLAAQDLSAPLAGSTKDSLETLRRLLLSQLERETAGGETRLCALTELRRLDSRLPDPTCLDNLLFTLKISSGNVVGLLHWLLEILGRHPDWAARARGDLAFQDENGGSDLVDRLVMETLRLAQSEYLYRMAADDIDFEGFRFPKGWLLRLCVWESHRSPETFRDPESFDPDRFLSTTFPSSEYSPFGWGPHACNGVPLTNMICRTLIEELISGFEWRVASDGQVERDFRHWHHWRPSSALEVSLAPV